jgi:2-polyprenyl-6-methoxyphenol hydroxylase-like FAD-dependent oxidoreductase
VSIQQVLIIGGGLGGLCLAQGLKRAAIPFTLFERDTANEARGQGFRLRIDRGGQDALARCLPIDLLYLLHQTATQAEVAPWFIDTRARPIPAAAPSSWETRETVPDLCVNRQTLREILLSGIIQHVRFGHALADIEEREEDAVARFANGEEASGALLVGADGVGSMVRRRLAPGWEPQDDGLACLYGRTPATLRHCQAAGRDLCAGTSVVFADGFAAVIDVMTFAEPISALAARIAPDCRLSPVQDYFYWALTGPRERLGVDPAPQAPADLAVRVRHAVRGWAPALQAIILGGDPADWRLHPVRSLLPDRAWSAGRITMLGDAVHAMSPAGGLGASTALQDAADLAWHLGRMPDRQKPASTLRAYEATMRDRGAEAVRRSQEGSARLSGALAA